ncbi:MAG: hypothetical protein M1829_000193 [Trizodia sp. TS-e1964]|nr:MAG: hypothetical protein M1829_000193 [Trizodia sp. TS-e1964]
MDVALPGRFCKYLIKFWTNLLIFKNETFLRTKVLKNLTLIDKRAQLLCALAFSSLTALNADTVEWIRKHVHSYIDQLDDEAIQNTIELLRDKEPSRETVGFQLMSEFIKSHPRVPVSYLKASSLVTTPAPDNGLGTYQTVSSPSNNNLISNQNVSQDLNVALPTSPSPGNAYPQL